MTKKGVLMNKKNILKVILIILLVILIAISIFIVMVVKYLKANPPEKILENAVKKAVKYQEDVAGYTKPKVEEYVKYYNEGNFKYLCENVLQPFSVDNCIWKLDNLKKDLGNMKLYEVKGVSVNKDLVTQETTYTVKISADYEKRTKTKTKFKLLETADKKLNLISADTSLDDFDD